MNSFRRGKRMLSRVVVLAALTIVACGGETGLNTEVDATEAVAEVDAQINQMADEIAASEFQPDLEAAWSDLEADLREMVQSLNSQVAVDEQQIQARLEGFQAALDTVEVGDELRSVWDQLRMNVEEALGQLD